MTGRSLIIADSARDVLLAARAGKGREGLLPIAIEKCFTRGWIQASGEDGEGIELTKGGREACEKLEI